MYCYETKRRGLKVVIYDARIVRRPSEQSRRMISEVQADCVNDASTNAFKNVKIEESMLN